MARQIHGWLDSLTQNGAYQDTLILFLSDNGACAEASLTGIGDPLKDRAPRTEPTLPSYGKSWANASASPYRLYKHFAHEGGANTNFIAHWPTRIQSDRDWYRQPAQFIDIMSTVVDLTGATYPAEIKGQAVLQSVGIPLTPAFDGKPLDPKMGVVGQECRSLSETRSQAETELTFSWNPLAVGFFDLPSKTGHRRPARQRG